MIEDVVILSVVDVENIIVKSSLDVESINEVVSSFRLEPNEVMCFSVVDNVVVTFSMPKVGWTIEVRSYVVVVVSVKRSHSMSRIHNPSVYFLCVCAFLLPSL